MDVTLEEKGEARVTLSWHLWGGGDECKYFAEESPGYGPGMPDGILRYDRRPQWNWIPLFSLSLSVMEALTIKFAFPGIVDHVLGFFTRCPPTAFSDVQIIIIVVVAWLLCSVVYLLWRRRAKKVSDMQVVTGCVACRLWWRGLECLSRESACSSLSTTWGAGGGWVLSCAGGC